MSGIFITIEGGEGTGKTTQLNWLAEYLTERGHKVITTREPGRTEEAEKVRNLLVQRNGGEWTSVAECLLLFAARVQHVEHLIAPALADGKIVVSDRFSDSTYAYQGYGRGVDKDRITKIEQVSLDGFKPDLTIILDIDPVVGLERSGRRLAAESLGVKQTEDRFENLEIEFHEKLRAGFLDIAMAEPKRCFVIDAAQSPMAVRDAIIARVEEVLA